jgi:saccharopine dehydrogenase-like NADP-dependent oxidoreductase
MAHTDESRYQGFSRLLDVFRSMGLLDTSPLQTKPQTWNEVLTASIGARTGKNLQLKDVEPFIDQAGHSEEIVEEAKAALRW